MGGGEAAVLDPARLWQCRACSRATPCNSAHRPHATTAFPRVFCLQDGNKVKEMAFLFRAEADALAAPSPKASTPPAQPFAAEAAGGAAAGRDGLDAGAGPCSVKARVQQLQSAAKPAERPKEPRATRQPAAASAPSTRAAGAASKAAAPAPRPSQLRPPSTSSSYFSHTVTETRWAT